MTEHEPLADCPRCGVEPGRKHDNGCDIERCKGCGWQAMSCDCDPYIEHTTWTGRWPGHLECEEYGVFTSAADRARIGWGPHDLNTLAAMHGRGELVWCSERERLVRPEDNPIPYVLPAAAHCAKIADILTACQPDLHPDVAESLACEVMNKALVQAKDGPHPDFLRTRGHS